MFNKGLFLFFFLARHAGTGNLKWRQPTADQARPPQRLKCSDAQGGQSCVCIVALCSWVSASETSVRVSVSHSPDSAGIAATSTDLFDRCVRTKASPLGSARAGKRLWCAPNGRLSSQRVSVSGGAVGPIVRKEAGQDLCVLSRVGVWVPPSEQTVFPPGWPVQRAETRRWLVGCAKARPWRPRPWNWKRARQLSGPHWIAGEPEVSVSGVLLSGATMTSVQTTSGLFLDDATMGVDYSPEPSEPIKCWEG